MTTTVEQFKKDIEKYRAYGIDVDYLARELEKNIMAHVSTRPTKAEFEEFIEDGEGFEDCDTDELERYLKIAIELGSDHVIAVLEDELAYRASE